MLIAFADPQTHRCRSILIGSFTGCDGSSWVHIWCGGEMAFQHISRRHAGASATGSPPVPDAGAFGTTV